VARAAHPDAPSIGERAAMRGRIAMEVAMNRTV